MTAPSLEEDGARAADAVLAPESPRETGARGSRRRGAWLDLASRARLAVDRQVDRRPRFARPIHALARPLRAPTRGCADGQQRVPPGRRRRVDVHVHHLPGSARRGVPRRAVGARAWSSLVFPPVPAWAVESSTCFRTLLDPLRRHESMDEHGIDASVLERAAARCRRLPAGRRSGPVSRALTTRPAELGERLPAVALPPLHRPRRGRRRVERAVGLGLGPLLQRRRCPT